MRPASPLRTRPGPSTDPNGPRKWWQVIGLVLLGMVVAAAARTASIAPRPSQPFFAGSPLIMAHQGASGHAPTNTLESFRLAVEMKADVLEGDMWLTRDGVVVMRHDLDVKTTTDGSGPITDYTLEALRKLDAGYHFSTDGGLTFPYRGKGVRIPTLEELFQTFPEMRFNLEIKDANPALAAELWRVIRERRMEERVQVASFNKQALDRFRALSGGEVAASASRADGVPVLIMWKLGLLRLWQPRFDALEMPMSFSGFALDRPALIKAARRVNVHVAYWTINDPGEMRHLLELGAEGIITDYPDRLYQVMQDMGLR